MVVVALVVKTMTKEEKAKALVAVLVAKTTTKEAKAKDSVVVLAVKTTMKEARAKDSVAALVVVVENVKLDQINVLNAKKKAICQENVQKVGFFVVIF